LGGNPGISFILPKNLLNGKNYPEALEKIKYRGNVFCPFMQSAIGDNIMNTKRVLLLILLVLAVGCSREVKKEYYPDGNLKAVLNYKKGKLEGIAKYYYENGNLKERVNYRKGKRERTGTVYYESGELKVEMTYEDGKLISEKQYDKQGNLIKG
jgi:antitoxin component YwqK of YwqJK toxin-antitoxin module